MVDIPPDDLVIENYTTGPIGGQIAGSRPRAVKITHLPTGLIAISENERSQYRNRSVAMDMILGGLTSPHYQGS